MKVYLLTSVLGFFCIKDSESLFILSILLQSIHPNESVQKVKCPYYILGYSIKDINLIFLANFIFLALYIFFQNLVVSVIGNVNNTYKYMNTCFVILVNICTLIIIYRQYGADIVSATTVRKVPSLSFIRVLTNLIFVQKIIFCD